MRTLLNIFNKQDLLEKFIESYNNKVVNVSYDTKENKIKVLMITDANFYTKEDLKEMCKMVKNTPNIYGSRIREATINLEPSYDIYEKPILSYNCPRNKCNNDLINMANDMEAFLCATIPGYKNVVEAKMKYKLFQLDKKTKEISKLLEVSKENE